MSAIEKLEQRLSALEAEVARLKQEHNQGSSRSGHTWLERIYGSFAEDAAYLEAMRLGKEYRDEVKPGRKSRGRKK